MKVSMKRKIFCLLIVFALVFVCGDLFAQNAQDLRFDSIVSGTLSGNEIWYRISAADTGYATVETTGNVDTYLEVYDAQRNFIMDNDDYIGTNARVEFLVTRGSSYLIKLRGFDSSNTGPYRIFASFEAIPAATALNAGSFLTGNIAENEQRWYSVRTAQAGILKVETTGTLDTVLAAYNSSYVFIAQNDDGSGEGYNARLEIITQANQTYYFKLWSYGSGSYRIIASFEVPSATALNVGAFLSGNIVSGQNYWYSVRPTQSGALTVETTGSTDTYMYAYNSSYELLGEDDDGGDSGNACITINVQANQTYYFRLRGFSEYVAGPYRIMASISR